MDSTTPEISYLLGLIHADGSFYEQSQNRGKVSIEITRSDEDILHELVRIVKPYYSSVRRRERTTNFGEHCSSQWTICSLEFRDWLKSTGLQPGRKSRIVEPPKVPISRVDYVRGLIDGDGAISTIADGRPLISLITCSKAIKEYYLKFVEDLTGLKKTSTPNKRDGAYNIIVYAENAQTLAKAMYYGGCVALARKRNSAAKIQEWARPEGNRRRTWSIKVWSEEEDKYIMSHTTKESMSHLGRTAKSIKIRRWRLKKRAI